MNEISYHRNIPARIVWICGVIFSGMFLLLSFTRIGLAALDRDFSDFSTSLFFGVYGVLHLVTNNAYKTGRDWGKKGLLGLNLFWIIAAIYSGVTSTIELSQLTAGVVGLLSAGVIFLIVQEKEF